MRDCRSWAPGTRPMVEGRIAYIRCSVNCRYGALPGTGGAFVFAATSRLAQNAAAPAPETHGVVVTNMDRSVKPGDDFYQYANGDWLKRTELPPDRRYIDPNGLDFDDSNDLTRKRIAGLIE